MTTIYTRLSQANDKSATLLAVAGEASAFMLNGEAGHGSAAIIGVAMIASAIRLDLLTYTTKTKGKGDTVETFGVEHATDAARKLFTRYTKMHGVGETFKFGVDHKEFSAWRNRVLAMLYPFTVGETVQPYTKTFKECETATKEWIKSKGYKSVDAHKAALRKAIDGLDLTVKSRDAAKKWFDAACLYVALDDNGSLLNASDTDPKSKDNFGLQFMAQWFIPEGKRLLTMNDNPDPITTLKPVAKRSGALFVSDPNSDGTGTTPDPIRVSIAAFTEAWKLPIPKAEVEDKKSIDLLIEALGVVKMHCIPGVSLGTIGEAAFRDALNRMLVVNGELEKANIRNQTKPLPTPKVEQETAAEIANRANVTLVKSA